MKRRKRLTDLEKEAVRLLLTGLTNKEIAEALGTEEWCVKQRVARAMRKIGVKSSRQMFPRLAEINELVRPLSST